MEQEQMKTNSRTKGVIQLFDFLKTKGYLGELKKLLLSENLTTNGGYVILCITTNHFKHMRNIVTISLPKQLDEELEKEVKTGRFASKSEFVRCLIRLWQEEKLLRKLEQGRKEAEAGLGKEFKSMEELG